MQQSKRGMDGAEKSGAKVELQCQTSFDFRK